MQRSYNAGQMLTSPTPDGRGKHDNRPRRVSQDLVRKVNEMMLQVILKRGSPTHHGGRYRRDVIHLPSTLNFALLFEMFHELHDHQTPSYFTTVRLARENPALEEDIIEPLFVAIWPKTTARFAFGEERPTSAKVARSYRPKLTE